MKPFMFCRRGIESTIFRPDVRIVFLKLPKVLLLHHRSLIYTESDCRRPTVSGTLPARKLCFSQQRQIFFA